MLETAKKIDIKEGILDIANIRTFSSVFAAFHKGRFGKREQGKEHAVNRRRN